MLTYGFGVQKPFLVHQRPLTFPFICSELLFGMKQIVLNLLNSMIVVQKYKFIFVQGADSIDMAHELFDLLQTNLTKSTFKNAVFQIEQGAEQQHQDRFHIQGALRSRQKLSKAYVLRLFSRYYSSLSYCSRALELLTVDVGYSEWDEIANYAMKNDSRVLSRAPFVLAPSELYLGQDLPSEDDLYLWQKQLTSILKTPEPSNRIIHVLWDVKGGIGKSTFIKRLLYTDKRVGYLSVFSTSNQLASALLSFPVDTWLYVIDIPRGHKLDPTLWSVFELLKGGIISTSFYGKGVTRLINPPQILITTNVLPDLATTLSLDRWKIFEVDISRCEVDPKDRPLISLDVLNILQCQEDEKTRASKEKRDNRDIRSFSPGPVEGTWIF